MTQKTLSSLFEDLDAGRCRVTHAEFQIHPGVLAQVADFVLTLNTGMRAKFMFDEKVNDALCDRRVRMATREQEALRFGEFLLFKIRGANKRFGRDCVNLALWDVVFREFQSIDAIVAMLAHIQKPTKAPPLEKYVACCNIFENALNQIGTRLVSDLRYRDDGTAYSIQVGAVIAALDWKYNISGSRSFFGQEHP